MSTDESGWATELGEKICKILLVGIVMIGRGYLYGLGACSAALTVARIGGLI